MAWSTESQEKGNSARPHRGALPESGVLDIGSRGRGSQVALRRPERSPNEMPKSHFNVVTQIPGRSDGAGDRTRDAFAGSSNNYIGLSGTDSGPHCETARTDGDSRRSASDSRQLALGVAKPSDTELEQAIVQAITVGALDVARVLADRLEARRRERGGSVVPLTRRRRDGPR